MKHNDEQSSSNQLYCVEDNVLTTDFPPIDKALRDPDGLLAIGGDLSEDRLLDAYKKGIFPWFNEGQPIMWWSPDPRCILLPEEIKISRSLNKTLRKNKYRTTYDTAFLDVINACSAKRKYIDETWITVEMKQAYINLFKLGYAHSVECWLNEKLVGGLYGIAMGKVFFGESMFSKESDASKVALVSLAEQLVKNKFKLIDCQVYSNHLHTLGAKPVKREFFMQLLNNFCNSDKTLFTEYNPSRSNG